MIKLNTARAYPQWKAARVTSWEGRTRWVAMNDQTGFVQHPERPGKNEARHLADSLSAQERQRYKVFAACGTD